MRTAPATMRSVSLQSSTAMGGCHCREPANRCSSRTRSAMVDDTRQHSEQTQRRPQHSAAQVSRRGVLWGVTWGVALLGQPGSSSAAELWQLAEGAVKLPRGYEDTSTKLVQALRESIEMDLSDASEREVRRKADGAKSLVKDWMVKWKDNPLVASDAAHSNIQATIEGLGQFYMKAGQRARLPSATGRALLDRLDAAAVALPLP